MAKLVRKTTPAPKPTPHKATAPQKRSDNNSHALLEKRNDNQSYKF